MAEGFCVTVILYFFLVLIASGSDILCGRWTGMEALFMPFAEETGRLVLMPAICNVLLSMSEMVLFLRRCDQHVSMRCYEIRTGNRVRLFRGQKKDLYRFWMAVTAGCIAVDVFVGIVSDQIELASVGYMMISFFLTSLLWMDSLYLLRVAGCDHRMTLFTVLLLILLSLLLLPQLGGMSFFAYGSFYGSWMDLAVKLFLETMVFLAGFVVTMKCDLL